MLDDYNSYTQEQNRAKEETWAVTAAVPPAHGTAGKASPHLPGLPSSLGWTYLPHWLLRSRGEFVHERALYNPELCSLLIFILNNTMSWILLSAIFKTNQGTLCPEPYLAGK